MLRHARSTKDLERSFSYCCNMSHSILLRSIERAQFFTQLILYLFLGNAILVFLQYITQQTSKNMLAKTTADVTSLIIKPVHVHRRWEITQYLVPFEK